MHHISVQIINDTDSSDSVDDFGVFLDEDVGDKDVFMSMWNYNNNFPNNVTEDIPQDQGALQSIEDAFKNLKSALNDMTILKNVIQSNITKKNFASGKIPADSNETDSDFTAFEALRQRKTQLEESSQFLLNSAESLKKEIESTRQYFREIDQISQHFPLKLVQTPEKVTKIAIDTAISSNNYIYLNEKENNDNSGSDDNSSCIEWTLSTKTHFSYNGKSFMLESNSSFIKCLFDLMCHQLFERIKDDQIKSAIHYSADKDSRSIYFDIGTKETWVFELGAQKTIGDIPVWIPKLIHYILNPKAQPASYMRQLLYYLTTLSSLYQSFMDRFIYSDFCQLKIMSQPCSTAFQVSSPHLIIPYIAFIDKWRVSMTETPNEMRCIPYSTDGRGLTPSLEKWSDSTFATLFLSMAERITRSFGYVFKNKNQYGTAAFGGRKIKFKPIPKSHDVEISITSHSTKKKNWNQIPGSDYYERMCVILFTDLN